MLINLSKRKLKKTSSKTLELRAQHHLDRRLSLSVPDLLEAEALVSEGRPYCGPQSSYTSVPSSLSTAGIVPKSSSSSLKQSEEELDWSQEEVGPFHMETDSEETFTSPAEDRRASSNGTLGLLQKTPSAEDASEGPEVRPGLGAFLFFFFLSAFSALGNFGWDLFLWLVWTERMSFITIYMKVILIVPSVPLRLGVDLCVS